VVLDEVPWVNELDVPPLPPLVLVNENPCGVEDQLEELLQP
jgi:hypothetical protein